MKKLLILLLSALSLTVFAQQKKVAVYVTGQQSGITKVLGDQLVVAFAKSGKYEAIERTNSFLAELSKEQNYQRSGAVHDNDIARLGIQFGVNYVCVADMSDVFGEKYISARLIDVETAVVLNAHHVSGKMSSMNECLNMASEIADYLSRGTFEEQQKAHDEEIRKEQLEQERLQVQREAELQRRELIEQQSRLGVKVKYLRMGYVDLGLPSATLWKSQNEGGDDAYYTYQEAKKQFKDNLPNYSQLLELINLCSWTWTGSGYKVVGPNGNYIELPANGEYHKGEPYRKMDIGWYWSSSSDGFNYASALSFDCVEINVGGYGKWVGGSVRLVK